MDSQNYNIPESDKINYYNYWGHTMDYILHRNEIMVGDIVNIRGWNLREFEVIKYMGYDDGGIKIGVIDTSTWSDIEGKLEESPGGELINLKEVYLKNCNISLRTQRDKKLNQILS
jgi:hypothetical protein